MGSRIHPQSLDADRELLQVFFVFVSFDPHLIGRRIHEVRINFNDLVRNG